MTKAQRRRMNKLQSEGVFMTGNAADFPAGSPGAKITAIIKAKMDEALAQDATLIVELGEKRAAQEAKDESRDRLLNLEQDFSTAADGIADDVPGIRAQFKVPSNRSDQNLIAAATAFFQASEPHKTKLVEAGLDDDCREQLETRRDDFSEARDEWESAVGEHAAAVGALDTLFREMMALSRRRGSNVKLKYKNNPGKLAEWKVSSHLDRAPHSAKKNDEETDKPQAG